MQTTVELNAEAYELARRVAAQRRQSVSEVLNETILRNLQEPVSESRFSLDERGFPQIWLGRPISLEEVEAATSEE